MNYNFSAMLKETFKLQSLRPFQHLVIQRIFDQDTLPTPPGQLVILPTGSGKSICFQLPAALLQGITIIIYPLISLMNDQKLRMERAGIPIAALQGGQTKEQRKLLWTAIKNNKIRVIITNPETLNQKSILEQLKSLDIRLCVIDEAHTISQWGFSFRPSYLTLAYSIKVLQPHQILAFTATASDQVVRTIKEHLFFNRPVHLVRASPDRPNIFYRSVPTLSKTQAIVDLFTSDIPQPALVFCPTRATTETLAWHLKKLGFPVRYYHAGLQSAERTKTEQWFQQNPQGILCATNAYGMGVDKSNIRSVIHWTLPKDAESYLQESGRAGRDGAPAGAWVLISPTDKKTDLYSIFTSDACRRAGLLEHMDSEMETCSGCEWCENQVITSPEAQATILSCITYYPFHFTLKRAARVLSGNPVVALCPKHLRANPFFGMLSTWCVETIEEAIELLVGLKELALCKIPGFRKKLYRTRKRNISH